ncbi:hypothetical protein J11TS1_14280 [Oceanobacillus sp. J11TS1]|nr:hypothetical protein J11TS1_14280 [Oceanobacillus sp. J11TS1]
MKRYWKRHEKTRAPDEENPRNYWIYIEKANVYYYEIGGGSSRCLLSQEIV